MQENTSDLFLGVDLGTSSCKVAVVDRSGNIRSTHVTPYPLFIGNDGEAEQDPEDWWQAVVRGIKECIKSEDRDRIRSIGVTGQWSGTVPVDKGGKPVSKAIIWMDTRGAETIGKMAGGFPSISGYRIDKLMKWLRFTGGAPAHSGKDSLAHLLFIRHHMPDIYNRTHKFLEPKDFIVLRLTGKFSASWDNTALLWVTDNRNPDRIVYDTSLARLNGIDLGKLPDLNSPLDVVGDILPELSEQLGLPSGVRVVSGCGDMQCSLIGVGLVDEGDVHVYLGTSSWITAHVAFKKTDIFHNIASLPSGVPGKYFIPAEQENATNCLEYVSGLLSITGEGKYEEVERMCTDSPPGANGLIFLPWLYGERAPVENPFLKGGFLNLGLNNSRNDMIRAVMEGVAMNSRWLLGIVRKFMGKEIPEVVMAGGGVLLRSWAQIYADVLNVNVRVAGNPRYSTVKGAAILSAWGINAISRDDIIGMKAASELFVPKGENSVTYDRAFKVFLKYYENNKDLMASLNRRMTNSSGKVK